MHHCKQKKRKLSQNQKLLSILEDLPFFSAVSNIDLENLNLSITVNIKDLLAPLTQQIRELRDFLNLHTKCMDQKPNFNNDFFVIICDKDLLVENEIF